MIKLVNETADKYFIGNGSLSRKLKAMDVSIKENLGIVIPTAQYLVKINGENARFFNYKRK